MEHIAQVRRFTRNPEEFVATLDRGAGWATLFLYIAAPTAIGVLVGAFTKFGSHANPELFTALSLVLPVLVVAAVVESGLSLGVVVKRSGVTTETVSLVTSMVRGQMYSFVVAEALCLYAVGARHGSTLIVVSGAGTSVWLAIDISRGTLMRLLNVERAGAEDMRVASYSADDEGRSSVGQPTRFHPLARAYAVANVRRLRRKAAGRLRKAQQLENKLRNAGSDFDPESFFVRNMIRMRRAAQLSLEEADAIEQIWLSPSHKKQREASGQTSAPLGD